MKPEKQRIAIAEECGLIAKQTCFGLVDQIGCHIPNYLNDLNAIIGAVKSLPRDKMLTVLNYLQFIAINDPENTLNIIALATPQQWSEAFLRGVGRWEE